MASQDNIIKAALQGQNILKLDKFERQEAVCKLLETRSERQLAEEINIPHSTIHDWKTLRQDNRGENLHVSLSLIYRKISNLDPEKITDWGRIKMIKDKCEELLNRREGGKE